MTRRPVPLLLLAVFLAAGCAGPSKLAQRSDDKLAQGQMWQAWTLATRALDKAPANAEARASADRAATAIAADWQRRIRGLAAMDSMAAAQQVMEFVAFRTGAVRYTTVHVDPAWMRDEQALRQGAARSHYRDGIEAMKSKRPKSAYGHFMQAQRFWTDYRDSELQAARALEKATTRVAIVPLRASSGPSSLGRDVARSWRGDIAEHMQPGSYFSRISPSEDIERVLRVSELGRISRDEAIRLGRKAGADRIVWGSIGEVDSKSGFHLFTDRVARKVVVTDSEGRRTTQWVEVPIEVISRTRTVTVDIEYEVIAARDGATLARHRGPQTMKARVVWTAYTPEGSPDSYALVSEQTRSSDPTRVKEVEGKWSAVVGEGTTLAQVLEARKASSSRSSDRREVLGRIMAGAAFVFLEELPSTEELAFGALARGWKPLRDDLIRLDPVDDVDLGVGAVSGTGD